MMTGTRPNLQSRLFYVKLHCLLAVGSMYFADGHESVN